jgi:NADH dehydrogenase
LSRPGVLIIGGGFAGLECANALDPREFAVTLVDARSSFEFLPNIHELLSGVKRPSELRLPLASAMKAAGHRFVRARVSSIDPQGRSVRAGRRRLAADYLVIAVGAVDADYGIGGVSEYALGFKSVDQCQAIHERLETIAGTTRSRVVVVGGGLEGIEGLGEILRRYAGELSSITLVEARDRLLPGTPGGVHRHLEKLIEAAGVELVFDDAVERITPRTVLLASGRRLRSDATIWTGGPAPAPLLVDSGLAEPGSWVPVRNNLEHREHRNVFVVGDAAELPAPLRKQAYHALDMGRCAARNIERRAAGRRLAGFKPSPKPTLLAFGDMDTVLITDRIAVAGPALATGKEAVFTAVMAGLDRRGAPARARAVLERGLNASRRLLWPTLTDRQRLLRSGRLRTLT